MYSATFVERNLSAKAQMRICGVVQKIIIQHLHVSMRRVKDASRRPAAYMFIDKTRNGNRCIHT